ncbi:MAG: tyrosine-type recombinase/integrase [Candidatus Bathyarchaeota archaeon]|nr:tyrosine-type recombinase/integrase [Candidatus Bathyarchaeota archaeon]
MTEQSFQPNLELPYEWSLISGFVDDCEVRDYSPETIRSHRSNLRTIARYLDSQGFGFRDVDKNVLKKVLTYLRNTRGVGQKTIKSYFSALSSFYEYLVYEDLHSVNPVPSFRSRYLKTYKKSQVASRRKLLSVEQMSLLINSVLEIRVKTIMTVFAKTGIRRGALIGIDVDDIDWSENYIKLKKRRKRSNPYVFFDEETAVLLARWLRVRSGYAVPGEKALFIGEQGKRIGRNIVYKLVTKHAERLGLHDSGSPRLEDHFSPHNFRHWLTTHLRRNGMSREFIKEIRGDSRGEAIDIYDHIDPDELRKAYLAAIPRLGII